MPHTEEGERSRIRRMSHVSRESKTLLQHNRPSRSGVSKEQCIATIKGCVVYERGFGNLRAALQLLEYQHEAMTQFALPQGDIDEVNDQIHNLRIDLGDKPEDEKVEEPKIPAQRRPPTLTEDPLLYGNGRRGGKSRRTW